MAREPCQISPAVFVSRAYNRPGMRGGGSWYNKALGPGGSGGEMLSLIW